MIHSLLLIASLAFPPALAADATALQYQTSYALEAADDLERSLRELEGIRPRGQDAYILPLRRGWLLYLMGRSEESAEAYREAIDARPEGIEAMLGATLPLMGLRRWAQVQALCEDVLEVAPGSFLAQSRLAHAQYRSGRYADSEAGYLTLVKRYPGDMDMRSGLGWARLKQGKKSLAQEDFAMVLHVLPGHRTALQGAAETL